MINPVVTVITVVFRGEAVIGNTMRSVAMQSYQEIEHLVIDGASDDKTLQIIESYDRPGLRYFSEPDKGIYDAMNKGLRLAKGRYVIFLNAGDIFYDDHVLEDVLGLAPEADFYYGNTAVINSSGEIIGDRRLAPPEVLTWKSFRFGMCVSHQSMIAKREICPEFDLKYSISADIDWTIRLLKNSKVVQNSHRYIAKFLLGGVSSSRRKAGLMERFAILSKHYGLLVTIINHVWIALRFIIHFVSRRSMT